MILGPKDFLIDLNFGERGRVAPLETKSDLIDYLIFVDKDELNSPAKIY